MSLTTRHFVCVGVALVLAVADACAEPGYGEPLTITTGTVYRVGTVAQLKNAVNLANANAPATILISNGTYVLDVDMLQITNHNIIIRSLSGDRDAVVIRGPGEGASAGIGYIFWIQGDTVTVADLTLGWCTNHGIQVHGQSPYDARGLWVHNCRIVNCYEQFIKGTSSDGDPEGVTDGLIENCLFEFTNRWAYQYYTGGIDVHKGVNWIVRDNLFKYIRAPDDYAEHAIHFWKRCTTRPQNIVVERNVVINCDRGIGFGLGGWADGHDGGSSVIRNNFVYNDGVGDYTDVGIGLESANDVTVDNNTVHVPYWAPIEYRFSGSSNLVFRNNLVNGSITARDGAPAGALSNNLESVQAQWFRNLTNGDLHIRPGVTNVIDRGCTVAAFSDDIDGHARPYGSAWDIGADEWDAERTDTDGDAMSDAWEITYDLDPTDPSDPSDNEDGDAYDNLSEWIALTDPTDSNDYFHIAGGAYTNSFTVWFECSTARVYSLEYRTNMANGQWLMADGQTNRPGEADGTMVLTDTNEVDFAVCRVGVSLP